MHSKTEINLIKYQFYSTVIADILKAVDGGSFGGAFVLSFCCIDYLGKPLTMNGIKANSGKNEYKRFISHYLTKVNKNYGGLHDQLYAIRCSLVHTYGESDASQAIKIKPQFLFGDTLFDHLRFETKKNKLYISLSDFISELISAVHLFFLGFSASNTDWSQKLYYPQNLNVILETQSIKLGNPIIYKSIHPSLEILDKENDMSQICKSIKNVIEKEINRH